MDTKQIGQNIAALRKSNGYTQETLAEKLNISPQAVSKWETGVGLPETSLLVALSDLLHTTIDEIFQLDKPKNNIVDFRNRNLAAPNAKLLNEIPRISRWNPPPGCDMYYSMPAMIAEALCCIEAYEKGESINVPMSVLNNKYYDLMHITGMGYGFLWNDNRQMVEELWQINDFEEMASNAMRYCGRDYLWLKQSNATKDEMRRTLVWSLTNNRPVVTNMCCLEFNIITGYEDNGNMLIGYTHCEECATRQNEYGMFVNPARWDEETEPWILVIGDKIEPSFSDKDTMEYALSVLDKNTGEPNHFHYDAVGDDGLRKWFSACESLEWVQDTFTKGDMYVQALYMNTIYTQKCILSYFKKLAERKDAKINHIVALMTIAIGRIEGERNSLGHLENEPEKYAAACRLHIENLIKHREDMRGWIKEIIELL